MGKRETTTRLLLPPPASIHQWPSSSMAIVKMEMYSHHHVGRLLIYVWGVYLIITVATLLAAPRHKPRMHCKDDDDDDLKLLLLLHGGSSSPDSLPIN